MLGFILLTTLLFVLLQFGYYNLEFQQWQGRYVFAALIPIACILVFGVDYWRARLLSRWDCRALADAAGAGKPLRLGSVPAGCG